MIEIPKALLRYRLTPVPFVPDFRRTRRERLEAMYGHFGNQIDAAGGFHLGGAYATKALLSRGYESSNESGSLPARRVLDLCCGIGRSYRFLKETFNCVVVGLDLVYPQLLKMESPLRVCGDALALPFGDDLFDIVWSEDAFSHIQDRRLLLSEVYRVMSVGGTLMFSDLVRGRISAVAERRFTAAWCLERLETANSYRDLLENVGFSSVRVVSVGREMFRAHCDEEAYRGDVDVAAYKRWLIAKGGQLRHAWGNGAYEMQLERLKMYVYLANGMLDHLFCYGVKLPL